MSFKAPAAPPLQMKPNRPNSSGPERAAPAQQRPRNRAPGQLPLAIKLLVSLLIVWHVTAVFLAPLSIPPSSPLVVDIAQRPPMQWYLDALYLNHGYHFFAPEPSNGHLIRYQIMDERGGVVAQGEFPSKKDNWPRLLYHRYFMLADQCEVAAANDAESTQWQQTYLKNYAQQLLREHGGAAARVQRVTHYPLMMRDSLEGKPLTFPETYRTEMEVVERRQDLNMPPPVQNGSNQSGTWNNNWRQDVASGWQGGVR